MGNISNTNLDELEESLEILYKNGFITDRKL